MTPDAMLISARGQSYSKSRNRVCVVQKKKEEEVKRCHAPVDIQAPPQVSLSRLAAASQQVLRSSRASPLLSRVSVTHLPLCPIQTIVLLPLDVQVLGKELLGFACMTHYSPKTLSWPPDWASNRSSLFCCAFSETSFILCTNIAVPPGPSFENSDGSAPGRPEGNWTGCIGGG